MDWENKCINSRHVCKGRGPRDYFTSYTIHAKMYDLQAFQTWYCNVARGNSCRNSNLSELNVDHNIKKS